MNHWQLLGPTKMVHGRAKDRLALRTDLGWAHFPVEYLMYFVNSAFDENLFLHPGHFNLSSLFETFGYLDLRVGVLDGGIL